ncbi:MAG: tyrosine decarboxylase MfnA [Promethearchaeati archaeon SRVP18_Atabeyarchaeia-1]
MEEQGIPANKILQELEERTKNDYTHDSGRILGSMISKPHRFASEVYIKYLEKNLGDPGLCPGVAEIEKEAIGLIGSLLHHPNASGNIVTGGTEANLIAMAVARNMREDTRRPTIIMPRSAHVSFDKAASLLCLHKIKVGLNRSFQMNVDELKRSITGDTVAIVAVAGTTVLGVVDPIEEISEIAEDKGIFMHVDAAFGGFVLPFLRELGYDTPDFDFRLKGVSSMTIDPHKMGFCPIPAGGILFRKRSYIKYNGVKVPYLAGGIATQGTIVGTRSGASACAVWALLKHLGRQGFMDAVKHCMELTNYLVDRIKNLKGVQLTTQPTLNMIGIKSNQYSIKSIWKRLRERKWAVGGLKESLRIVILPHIEREHVDAFLNDLQAILEELRS